MNPQQEKETLERCILNAAKQYVTLHDRAKEGQKVSLEMALCRGDILQYARALTALERKGPIIDPSEFFPPHVRKHSILRKIGIKLKLIKPNLYEELFVYRTPVADVL